MKVQGYLQIVPQFRANAVTKSYKLTGANIDRVTKLIPVSPLPGAIIVLVKFDVPESAFEPYEATGTIPEGTRSLPLEIEALDPDDFDVDDDDNE